MSATGHAASSSGTPPGGVLNTLGITQWTDERIALSRRLRSRVFFVLCGVALVCLVGPVVWLLTGVTVHGLSSWRWGVLTHPTTGTGGGLSNAIVGTALLIVGVMLVAGIVGMACGIYISEMAPPGLRSIMRGGSEVLSGMPSIVFGYVGYVALVVALGWGYSLLAAVLVLSLLVVPYVAKSTELALSQVPLSYREGGEALGMSSVRVLRKVVVRSAIPGMATGLIVALAISVGETAPLLYTAGWTNSYPTLHLVHSPVPYLTYVTYNYWDEPYTSAVNLSHVAAFVLVVLVMLLILSARLVVHFTQKYSPDRATSAKGSRRRKTRSSLSQLSAEPDSRAAGGETTVETAT